MTTFIGTSGPAPVCWIAFTLGLEDECDRVRDLIHVGFKENWLLKAATGPRLTKDQANDPRLLRDGCRKHHQALDFGPLELAREDIPDSVEEFAAEHGPKLLARLDSDFGPRPREAT